MNDSVYLHLSTTRKNGGSFQYELNALDACLHLASQGVQLTVAYEHADWEAFIPDGVVKMRVPHPSWLDPFFKGMTLLHTPLWILRFLFRVVHPVRRVIPRSPAVGKFYPSQECPLAYLAPGPAVGVVHDLMHRYETSFPEAAAPSRRRYRDRHFQLLAMAVEGVCVDSELGRHQLAESYRIQSERIDVLPFAVPPYAFQEPPGDFDQRYALPSRFLFYPATLWRHKNHACLLRAMAALLPRFEDLHLVLVGGSGNAELLLNKLIQGLGLKDRVHLMGYVPDADMAGFFRRARALVMPSFFGPTNIPPLEAMHHGCPVLVSNSYAMPEQCGDAAIYFNPTNPEELSRAIARLWTDDDLVRELAEKGKARSDQFSPARFSVNCAAILRRRLSLGEVRP